MKLKLNNWFQPVLLKSSRNTSFQPKQKTCWQRKNVYKESIVRVNATGLLKFGLTFLMTACMSWSTILSTGIRWEAN